MSETNVQRNIKLEDTGGTTMRAATIERFGGPEVLETREVVVPEPGDGQVRIRVEATSVNPVDAITRRGLLVPPEFPMTLGWDVAGEIDALGKGVEGFAVGDPVLTMLFMAQPSGSYAEYVVVDAEAVGVRPATLSAEDAATVPLAGLTASQGLDLIGIEEGETIAVNGALGAVGGFVTQLAVHTGASVVAVVRVSEAEAARALGASTVVDRDGDVAAQIREKVTGGVDAAFDVVGNKAAQVLLDAVRDAGRYVSTEQPFLKPDSPAVDEPVRSISMSVVSVVPDGDRVALLAELMEGGELTPRIEHRLPLEKVAEAHRLQEAGGLRAKIVLVP